MIGHHCHRHYFTDYRLIIVTATTPPSMSPPSPLYYDA